MVVHSLSCQEPTHCITPCVTNFGTDVCAPCFPQFSPQHPDHEGRIPEARRRSEQVADSVESQRCHRIGMCCFVQPGEVPVDRLNAHRTSAHRLGNAHVVADHNGPGNLNDLSCSTKPSRLSAALPSIFGSLMSFFRLMPHHTTIQECSPFCTSLLLAQDQFDRRSRRRTRIPRRLLDLRLVAELAKRPVSSVQPPESIPCRRRCRPAGPG